MSMPPCHMCEHRRGPYLGRQTGQDMPRAGQSVNKKINLTCRVAIKRMTSKDLKKMYGSVRGDMLHLVHLLGCHQDARGLATSWTTFNIRFTLRFMFSQVQHGWGPSLEMETSYTND